MSWEQRGDRRYYYRHEWVAGRAVRIYAGAGAAGEQAADDDAQRRAQAESDARFERQLEQRRVAAEAPLAELCQQTDKLVHACLLAAGYHQHDRSSWRRRRERRNPTVQE